MRAFYEALKAVYGPSHQIQAPLCSSDGSILLTDKEAILQHWSEHFEGLFSDRHTAQESSLVKIPQLEQWNAGTTTDKKQNKKTVFLLKCANNVWLNSSVIHYNVLWIVWCCFQKQCSCFDGFSFVSVQPKMEPHFMHPTSLILTKHACTDTASWFLS